MTQLTSFINYVVIKKNKKKNKTSNIFYCKILKRFFFVRMIIYNLHFVKLNWLFFIKENEICIIYECSYYDVVNILNFTAT